MRVAILALLACSTAAPPADPPVGRAEVTLPARLEGDVALVAAEAWIVADAEGDGLAGETLVFPDVDGDGTNELVVTAHLSDRGGPDEGIVHVFDQRFEPGAHTTDEAVATWLGEVRGSDPSAAGTRIRPAGDPNGDGVPDLLVCTAYDAEGVTPGAGYVLFGPWSGVHNLSDADVRIVSDADTSDRFGVSGAGAGDLDGEGGDDVVFTAGQNTAYGVEDAGTAYLFVSPMEEVDDPGDARARARSSASACRAP